MRGSGGRRKSGRCFRDQRGGEKGFNGEVDQPGDLSRLAGACCAFIK